MIVTLRLAEEKIKESQIEKGGIPPDFADRGGVYRARAYASAKSRAPATNCRATKCRTPTSSSTHAREHTISRASYPQDIHNVAQIQQHLLFNYDTR